MPKVLCLPEALSLETFISQESTSVNLLISFKSLLDIEGILSETKIPFESFYKLPFLPTFQSIILRGQLNL